MKRNRRRIEPIFYSVNPAACPAVKLGGLPFAAAAEEGSRNPGSDWIWTPASPPRFTVGQAAGGTNKLKLSGELEAYFKYTLFGGQLPLAHHPPLKSWL